MNFLVDDYIDADVSYFAGLLIARGEIAEIYGIKQVLLHFPFSSLLLQGRDKKKYDQETSIKLGLNNIRERLQELFDTDISIIEYENHIDLAIRFLRKNMIWRNILLLTNGETSFHRFSVPNILFNEQIPKEWKMEFIRGFADVAGNIRRSNRDQNKPGINRVRLDILNHKHNWHLPVQLCELLQKQLDIPVNCITWGHPNNNREWREHQLNIYTVPFLKIGFSFEHKQNLLIGFAKDDRKNHPKKKYNHCPGIKRIRKKEKNKEEKNKDRLDPSLLNKHFDAGWQICKELGCYACIESEKKKTNK